MKVKSPRQLLRLLLPVAVSIMCSLPLHAQQLKATLSHYSTYDGMASNAISCIKRDDYGYIWIATWNGLSRFDGYHFYNYVTGNRSGVPFLHNRIWSIQIDRQQNVWLRMYDDRVFVLNRLTDKIQSPFEDIEGGENFITSDNFVVTSTGEVIAPIRDQGIYVMHFDKSGKIVKQLVKTNGLQPISIVEGEQGTLWVGTDKGVHRLNLSDGTLQAEGVCENEGVNCLYFHDGQVYVGTDSGKLISFTSEQKPKTLADLRIAISSLFVDSHNLIWFSQEAQGVSRLNPQTGQVKNFTQEVFVPQYDVKGAVMIETNGTVWIAMNHGGFGYYNRENDEVEYFHNDPSNTWNLLNTVDAFIPLPEGVLWESTARKGLEKLEILQSIIGRERLFNDTSGSTINEVRAFCYDQKRDLLLIGNKMSTLCIMSKDGKRMDLSSDSKGRPLGRIYGITMDRAGNYWVSSKGSGVIVITPQGGGEYAFSSYVHSDEDPNTLSSDNAYCTIEDKSGNIWIATYNGGVNLLMKQKDGSFQLKHKDNGLNYPKDFYQKVRTLTLDKEDHVWAGTTDGLLMMSCHDGHFEVEEVKPCKDPEHIISSTDIICLACDAKGSVWVGTNGGGLSHTIGRDDDGYWMFENFDTKDGLPSDEIRSLVFDKNGNVWIATERELVSFDVSRRVFCIFSTQDGVDDTLCSECAAIVMPDGNIIFGTLDGYYLVDRKKLVNSSASQLKLRITDFWIDDELVSPRLNDLYNYYVPESSSVELPSRTSSFAFRFASLDYQLQHRVLYQYMLEGYDETWQNADSRRTASYQDLPAGVYLFRVKAFLLESPDRYDMRTIEVTVPPFWFMSPAALWCYLVIISFLTVVIFFVLKERRKTKRRRLMLKIGADSEIHDKKGDSRLVEILLKCLEDRYMDSSLTLDDLVSQSSLGRAAYVNRIESLTQMPLKEFVTNFRLKKAIALFNEQPDISVPNVVKRTGFSDPVYFAQAFKTLTGMSPTAYRKNLMKEKETHGKG